MSQFVLLMTEQPGRQKSPKDHIVAVRECLAKKDAQLGSHRHLVAALHTEAASKQQEVATMRHRIVAARHAIAATCEEAKDLSLELHLLELELHRTSAAAAASASVSSAGHTNKTVVRAHQRPPPPNASRHFPQHGSTHGSSRPALFKAQSTRTTSRVGGVALTAQHAQHPSTQGRSAVPASRDPDPRSRRPTADAPDLKRHCSKMPVVSNVPTGGRRYPPPPSPDELFSMCLD